MNLSGKNILITGSARRLGKVFALSVAQLGATVILHHAHSPEQAEATRMEIKALGSEAYVLEADLGNLTLVPELIDRSLTYGPLYALVNNAAIFENRDIEDTDLESWQRHLTINLTAPFLLSQAFAAKRNTGEQGRIVNILDWRALRPGPDHLPYSVSKAALAALTRSLAQALAPDITVNGLALGAVLPPSTGEATGDIIQQVPIKRWAMVDEVAKALIFLLTGPSYITGEIIHVDGGRHLT